MQPGANSAGQKDSAGQTIQDNTQETISIKIADQRNYCMYNFLRTCTGDPVVIIVIF